MSIVGMPNHDTSSPMTPRTIASPVLSDPLTGTPFNSKYANLNLSINSLDSLSSEEHSPIDDSFITHFNSKLKCYSNYTNIFVLTSINQVLDLLDFFYNSNVNPMATNLFPYLHGLYNDRQRVFFNDKFRNEQKDDFNLEEFSHLNTLEVPEPTNFNLMTLNTEDSNPSLVNSIGLDEMFDFTNVNSSPGDGELNNRNYKLQIKLMAHLSSFLIYNNNCNLLTNLKVAMNLSKLIGSDRFVYVLNFNKIHWQNLPVYYMNDYNYRMLDNLPINSINNEKFGCKLLKWEQNLLWKNNSMKWFTKSICLGNLIDYNLIRNKPADFDFKLIINCTEQAGVPRMSSKMPKFVDFPSSGSFNFESLTYPELLNFLNLLKHVHKITSQGGNVFIFSFDGFTGLSLLTLAVGLMLTDLSLERLILNVYSNDSSLIQNNLKLYFFKNDLAFLKHFERFVKWAREHELKGNDPIKALNYPVINSMPLISEKLDWFDMSKDNNFPCKIFKRMYLGSIKQTNSLTVMNCLKFNRVLSIGERPSWLSLNRYNDTNTKPIYKYKNAQGDEILVYDIKISISKLPFLKSLTYIKNSKDDGKDSILPLLIEAPPHVQQKILIDPKNEIKTLVHCKIGVSRSASICIASLMKHQQLSLIESYMLVRINRFNIIIQPNLKLFYDLYYYENHLNRKSGIIRRSHTWWNLCHEIHKLNSHYIP